MHYLCAWLVGGFLIWKGGKAEWFHLQWKGWWEEEEKGEILPKHISLGVQSSSQGVTQVTFDRHCGHKVLMLSLLVFEHPRQLMLH